MNCRATTEFTVNGRKHFNRKTEKSYHGKITFCATTSHKLTNVEQQMSPTTAVWMSYITPGLKPTIFWSVTMAIEPADQNVEIT
jgi:hypothetical protein